MKLRPDYRYGSARGEPHQSGDGAIESVKTIFPKALHEPWPAQRKVARGR